MGILDCDGYSELSGKLKTNYKTESVSVLFIQAFFFFLTAVESKRHKPGFRMCINFVFSKLMNLWYPDPQRQ